jgi:hypothetical protein
MPRTSPCAGHLFATTQVPPRFRATPVLGKWKMGSVCKS